MPLSDVSSPASEDEGMPAGVEDCGEVSDSEPENADADGDNDRDGEDEEEEAEEEEEGEEEEEEWEEEAGEEVEEEEVDDDQEEGEEGDDDEDRESADLSDSPAAADDDDDINDSSHDIESKGHNEDLRLEKTEGDLASCVNHDKEKNVGLYDPFSLNESIAKRGKEQPRASGDSNSRMSGDNLDTCEANGHPESVADYKGDGVQMENDTSILNSINAQKVCHESENKKKVHLGSSNSLGADVTESLCLDEMEMAAENLMKDGSDAKVSSSIPISQREVRLIDMESGEDIRLRSSSSITPQLRPRSLSPGAEVKERNKKSAIICDFFAKGWCIKGSSCRFLHLKDGVKENVVVGSLEEYSQEDAGLRQEAENSKFPSTETLNSSIVNDPSAKSHFLSAKITLGEHGESKRSFEECKLPSFGKGDISSSIAESENSHVSEQLPLPNEFPWKSSIGEEYKSFGVPLLHRNQSPRSDFRGDERLRSELLGRHSLGGNNSVSSYRFSSSGSTISSSIYGNSNTFGYGKSNLEPPSLKLETHSVIYSSRTSPEFNSSLSSSFNTALPSVGVSTSNQTLAWSGSSPSRSSSLPRSSSSPFYSRSAQESLPPRAIARDPSVSIVHMAPFTASSWEPSVPFRPSFHFSSIISSPSSQYDPLLDSIEPPNGGVTPLQPSFNQGSPFHNSSHQQITGDSITFSIHPQPAVSNSHGMGAYTTAAGAAETFTADQQNRSAMSNKEKPSKAAGHVVSTSNLEKVDPDCNPRHQTDGSKYSKEAKVLKLFRASLVDSVKELVKPFWREGQLSKDAHNIIVKKAVDKVLNALQPHQIPSTPESINQYFSSSRPKLAKLVEGYVGKYGKS